MSLRFTALTTWGKPFSGESLGRSQMLELFASFVPVMVGIESCHAAHYWGREIAALGHDVRLMPPTICKALGQSQKNHAADAEAIAEAVQRPTMWFVPVKIADHQRAVLMMHRTRELLVRQRSSLISAIRALRRIRHRSWTRHPQYRSAARVGGRTSVTCARG
jgi:transposase